MEAAYAWRWRHIVTVSAGSAPASAAERGKVGDATHNPMPIGSRAKMIVDIPKAMI